MEDHLLNYLQSFITERRKELFQDIVSKRTRHFTVVTEDVYQLHNTSAVMRSCDVFGIQDLHVIEEKYGQRIEKEIAMGAPTWVSIHRYTTTQQCLDSLKAKDYQIVAATPHNDSQYLHDFNIDKKTAFFFGKEKDGLSDMVLNQADACIKIPMYGFTESLNISVSAAIILQHVVTNLKNSSIPWQLSDTEQADLMLDWTKKSIKSIDQILENYNKGKY